eukprot:1142050-Pelagomonas_calceolata.AAC.8
MDCPSQHSINLCTQFQHLFSSATPSSASRLRDLMDQADALGLAKKIGLVWLQARFASAKLPPQALPSKHNYYYAFGKPLQVPRYLYLDSERHMQRNIACFRLHAHKLKLLFGKGIHLSVICVAQLSYKMKDLLSSAALPTFCVVFKVCTSVCCMGKKKQKEVHGERLTYARRQNRSVPAGDPVWTVVRNCAYSCGPHCAFSWLVDNRLKHFTRPFSGWSWWVFGQLLPYPGRTAERFPCLLQVLYQVRINTSTLLRHHPCLAGLFLAHVPNVLQWVQGTTLVETCLLAVNLVKAGESVTPATDQLEIGAALSIFLKLVLRMSFVIFKTKILKLIVFNKFMDFFHNTVQQLGFTMLYYAATALHSV